MSYIKEMQGEIYCHFQIFQIFACLKRFQKTFRFICKNRTDMASFFGCFFTLYANHAQNSSIRPLTSGAAGRVRTVDAGNINYRTQKKKSLYFTFIFLTNFKPGQPT